MKKLFMCFAGAMMVLSLAACKPTEVTETVPTVAESANPEVLTPEIMMESTEVPAKLPDANAPILEKAALYSINSAGTGLVREIVDLDEMTEETLMEQLVEKGVLDSAIEINTFGISGDIKAGPGVKAGSAGGEDRIGSLDLAQAVSADASKEQMILNAIANTFIENYELDKLEILINGEPYTSANITMAAGDYMTLTDGYEDIKN